jgi:hypothetical protein
MFIFARILQCFYQFLTIHFLNDAGITPTIEVWHGQSQGTIFETSTTGDNGLWNQTIALENATRLRIEYHGSGSLAELLYRYCPPN